MKTKSFNLAFQGVKPFGFVKSGEVNFIEKLRKQINNAQVYAKELEKEGRDSFVVKMSEKNSRGQSHGEVKTYVLFDEDAKIPKQYEIIKQNLIKFFKDDLISDLFTNSLDKKLEEISKQQSEVAKFIAENKAPLN